VKTQTNQTPQIVSGTERCARLFLFEHRLRGKNLCCSVGTKSHLWWLQAMGDEIGFSFKQHSDQGSQPFLLLHALLN
jgi:hypothetical protein